MSEHNTAGEKAAALQSAREYEHWFLFGAEAKALAAAIREDGCCHHWKEVVKFLDRLAVPNAGVAPCETEQDCTGMPWCRLNGKCQRTRGVSPCGEPNNKGGA